MKDSGIEWIGEIPEDWDVVKIKHLADHKEGLFLDGDWIESDIITSDGVRYLTTGNIGEGYFKEQGDGFISEETLEKMNCLIVYPGDLVISRLNKPIGRACLLPDTHEKYVIAVDNVVLRPNPKLYNRLFLKFAMNIDGYSEEANMISRGATMPRISRTLLGNIKLPIPPYHQQHKISNFLDKKVAEIDHILEKTRESIEEYKKYKQSIITEAVTKGLNPDVKMKDSGIEWIGEIPEHWRLCKITNIIDVLTDFTANGSFADLAKNVTYLDGEGFARVVRLTDLRVNFENPGVYVSEETFNYLKKSSLFGGEILIANVGAYAGLMCEMPSVDFKATLGPNMMLIKVKENLIFPHYLFLLSMCTYFEKQLQLKAISSAQPKLNKDDVRSVRFVLPPLYEQKKISDFIDSKVSNIDNLITQKEQLLSDLEAYKKSLIYECVTGKREVV